MLDHDVELNPVYGVTLDDDGQLSAEADDTSVVVSDEAGYAAQPDQEDPPSQEEQDARPAAARLLGLCEPARGGPAGGAQGSTMNPSESIHS